jgi:starch-binding outer membrane protein, SusD/RagB family
MKKISSLKYLIGLIIPILLFAGCKKNFLVKPPLDSIVDASFYKTDEQVLAGTASLYNKVWFDYNDKAYYNLGDFRAGTAYSAYNDRGNVLFNTTAENGENNASWRAFFNVVAQSNLAIVNINKYAGNAVSPSVKKMAIAEARFMRALAYRFLVMNWGEVPVIENNLDYLKDTSLRKNTIPSIWRFITREMRAIVEDLPSTPVQPGRITKWTAEGMLARFYLTRAGVESTGPTGRKQQFLDSAKYYAQRVITQSGYKLLAKYEDLFKYPYDNNTESMFSLQWVYSVYGTANSMPAYLNFSNDIANGDGWGGDKSATWWMLSQYDGITASGDTMLQGRTLDTRLKTTFMLPGAKYPEITQVLNVSGNSITQKLEVPNTGGDVNFAYIKKYVVGKSQDVGGAAQQNYPNDTYMMRLAEMYLIYVEATIGNGSSTNDVTALQYFNAVHTRSGLAPYQLTDPITSAPTPLTFDMIFKERMLEFAVESMAWYDFVSLHYYNPQKAYTILNNQDRGFFNIRTDVFPNPTLWTFKKTVWATTERKVNASSGNFRLPIPSAEISLAPNLNKSAVEYP